MPGKCRPHLRAKTLENVKRSSLSQTDKDCIAEVFRRYETMADIVHCENCIYCKPTAVKGIEACIRKSEYVKPTDYCSHGERKKSEVEGE